MQSTEVLKDILKQEQEADSVIEKAKTEAEAIISEARSRKETKIEKAKIRLAQARDKFWIKKEKDILTKEKEILHTNSKKARKIKENASKNVSKAADFIQKEFTSKVC